MQRSEQCVEKGTERQRSLESGTMLSAVCTLISHVAQGGGLRYSTNSCCEDGEECVQDSAAIQLGLDEDVEGEEGRLLGGGFNNKQRGKKQPSKAAVLAKRVGRKMLPCMPCFIQ